MHLHPSLIRAAKSTEILYSPASGHRSTHYVIIQVRRLRMSKLLVYFLLAFSQLLKTD